MSEYLTIINRTERSESLPWYWVNSNVVGGQVSASVSAPTGQILKRVQNKHEQWRYASVDGKFSDVIKSGVVKMTPMHARTSSEVFPMGSIQKHDYMYTGGRALWSPNQPWSSLQNRLLDLESTWTEQGDIGYWLSQYQPDVYNIEVDYGDQKVMRAMGSVYDELLTSFSLGTELGQLSLTLQSVGKILDAVRSPLQSFRSFVKSLTKVPASKKAEMISQRWLEYRYAIMPLAYSAVDIYKLIKDYEKKYQTARRKVEAQFLIPSLPSSGTYTYQTVSVGAAHTSVVAKARFASGVSRTYNNIDMNLFTTAWELIPYSFVVDWFINISELIAIKAKSFTATADIKSCRGVRSNYQMETWLHLEWDETKRFTYSWTHPLGGSISYDVTRGSKRSEDILLSEATLNSYQRFLFTTDDLKFAWAPYLDWKRMLDAIALSNRQLSQALRRL